MSQQEPFPSSHSPDGPANTRSPDDWQALLAGYVLGDLAPDERAEVEQYLALHPGAEREVAALQTSLALLPLALADEALPPAGLQAQLLQAATATAQQPCPQEAQAGVSTAAASVLEQYSQRSPQQSPGQSPPQQSSPQLLGPGPQGPRRFPRAWGALAAAAAIALLTWQNLQLRSNLQLAQQDLQLTQQDLEFAQQRLVQLAAIETQLTSAQGEIADYQALIAALRLPENRLLALSGTPSFSETASGSVVIAPRQSWAILTLQGLPTPPPGKAYQLWAMADGQKVYCVEFKPDGAGQVLVEIPVGNWASTPTVSITLEDEGTIPTETSDMVMNGTVI